MLAVMIYPSGVYFMHFVQITHKQVTTGNKYCKYVEQLTTYRVFSLLETCYWPYEVFTCEVVQVCIVHIVVWFQGCYREIALRIPIVVHFDG